MKPFAILRMALLLVLALTACAPAAQVIGPPEDMMMESLIPRLEAPAGARLIGGGGGGGPGVQGLSVAFLSDLALEDIHAHFASQLADLGWREVDRQHTDGALITFLDLVDEGGTSWAAKLDAHLISSENLNEYMVDVQLLQPR